MTLMSWQHVEHEMKRQGSLRSSPGRALGSLMKSDRHENL
jgi:hypothetical protein